MVTLELEIYEFYKYNVFFYGYPDIYDYDEEKFYYYDDITGEKTYTEYDYATWHYFLDKNDVHYIDDIESFLLSQLNIKFNVVFESDTDQSQKSYDLNWDYDPTRWYQEYNKYVLDVTIKIKPKSNGDWDFDYPKEWKIKSLYEFHTESTEGGSGSGGNIEPNLTSVDFRYADDLSNVITAESMFSGCTKLLSVNMSKSILDNITNADYMFKNCLLLTQDSVTFNDANTFGNLESAYEMFFCNGDDNYDEYIDKHTSYTNESLITKILQLQNNGTFNTSIEYVYLKFVKDNKKYKINSGSTVHIHPHNYSGNITFPTTVSESNTTFSVTGISNYAFMNCSELVSVAFSNNTNITSISAYAFNGCDNLTSVTIPSNVTVIDYCAFLGCTSLTSISLPNNLTEIGYSAFAVCNIASLNIPSSVTTVGNGALACNVNSFVTSSDADFSYSELTVEHNNIKYRVLNKSEASVYGDWYYWEPEYSGQITIPSSITKGNTLNIVKIDTYAFQNCEITGITIPDSVTEVGDYAFEGTELTTLDMNVSLLNLDNLEDIYFTFTNNNILYLINSKTSLTILNIKNKSSFVGAITLSNNVYYKTNKFTSINISGYSLFKDCYLMTSLTHTGMSLIESKNMFENCTAFTTLTPKFSPDNVDCTSMFENCTSITSITNVMSNSLTITGHTSTTKMFKGCSSLSSLNLSIYNEGGNNDGLNMDEMFAQCTNMSSARITVEVEQKSSGYFSIGLNDTFVNCTNLATFELDILSSYANYVMQSGTGMHGTFKDCGELETFKIVLNGTGGTTLDFPVPFQCDSDTFDGCVKLKNIILQTSQTNLYPAFNSVSLSDSPLLTFDSMKNVCQWLNSGNSVTFNDALWSSLDSQQITTLSELAQNKGATITNLI